LIYVDMAYTLRIVRARHHEDFWHARHSGGYFPIVWGVHPLADVPDEKPGRMPRVAKFSSSQLVIEGTSRALRLPRWLLPLNFLVSQWLLVRTLAKRAKRRGASAVFVNDPLYSGLFGWILARLLRVPLIVFVPAQFDELYEATGALGNPRIFRTRRIEQAVMGLVFSRADMVFAAAESVAELALKYGARPDSIARLSHGKYLARCHLAEPSARNSPDGALASFGIPPAANYLICVGRQTAVKHPQDALRAMKMVIDARDDVVGIMAGVGELNSSLKQEARDMGIESRVAFPGLIDQPALSLILPHCVTLSPLTGMALIEASLAGSAVVAYDRDWQSEFVRDGESGFVVPFGDWRAMANRALQILGDSSLRSRLSAAARQLALDFVDLERNRRREHAALDAMFERWALKVGRH
jgi:glycosyltransferase involved in cell wall biosynthesis